MALEAGYCDGIILRHNVELVNDKPCVTFDVSVEGDKGLEATRVMVFLTDAAMNLGRASLRTAGFPVDTEDLSVLHDNPERLKGNRVSLSIEDYRGKLRAQLQIRKSPEPAEMAELTQRLRAVKGGGEAYRPPAPSAPSDNEPPPHGDNDIPF